MEWHSDYFQATLFLQEPMPVYLVASELWVDKGASEMLIFTGIHLGLLIFIQMEQGLMRMWVSCVEWYTELWVHCGV